MQSPTNGTSAPRVPGQAVPGALDLTAVDSGLLDASALVQHLAGAVSSTSDLHTVLQTVTDIATTLTGAELSAFFHCEAAPGEPGDAAGDAAGEGGADAEVLHVIPGPDAASFSVLRSRWVSPWFDRTLVDRETVRLADVADPAQRGEWGVPDGEPPLRSYLATPVVARDGVVVGALLLGHPDPGAFSRRSEDAVRLVAAHASVAVENTRLYAAQSEALALAEERTQSLQLLQEVTSRLAGIFTVDDAIDALSGTLAQHLGILRMGLYRLEGDRLRAMRARAVPTSSAAYAGNGTDAAWTSTADRVRNTDDLRTSLGLGEQDLAHFTSIPVAAPTVSRDALRAHEVRTVSSREEFLERYPDLARATPDVHAVVAVPMQVAGVDFGVLALSWDRPLELTPIRLRVLEAVGEQLCGTLERLDLFTEAARARAELRQHVAELTVASQTLQRSLLPGELPVSESVDVAVRYAPGAENAEVGGDWYDVVVAPGGRVTLVIGDVQGHSFSAAAVMGRVSTALRAYLSEGHPLDVALSRVNPIAEQAGLLVTCCLASLDPLTGEVNVARAGHPAPLFRRDGRVGQLSEEGGGPPLGIFGTHARWEVTTGFARPGDRLLLFTDGLVERTDVDIDTQIAALVQELGVHGDRSLEAAADEILARMHPARGDDVALLMADYRGAAGSPATTSAATTRVGDLASVSAARRFTSRKLTDWGLTALHDTATLLVSELVTNALLHASGPVLLELVPSADRLRVSVTDSDAQGPAPRASDPDAENGRGMILVEELAQAWGVDPHGFGKTVWAEVVAD